MERSSKGRPEADIKGEAERLRSRPAAPRGWQAGVVYCKGKLRHTSSQLSTKGVLVSQHSMELSGKFQVMKDMAQTVYPENRSRLGRRPLSTL